LEQSTNQIPLPVYYNDTERRTSISCVKWSSTFRPKWWRRRPMRHVPHAYWTSVL